MSRESISALRTALATDEDLEARLAAATTNAEFVRVASDAGFVITMMTSLSSATAGTRTSRTRNSPVPVVADDMECRPKYPETWNYCDW